MKKTTAKIQTSTDSTAPAKSRLNRKAPAPLALEQRLIFDADVAKSADTLAHADTADKTAAATAADRDTATVADRDATAEVPRDTSAVDTSVTAPREIVFIDTSVTDWSTIASNVKQDAIVILIDPSRDGLTQIQTALAGFSDLDAIHIVSHGSEGTLTLGNQNYTAANLDARAETLSAIGRALSADGDILLYGCDVGKGLDGVSLIGQLAQTTGADVAASTDDTGASSHGANWTLEKSTGDIGASLFLRDTGVAAYENWLSTVPLDGKAGWTAVMFGTAQDPQGDSQAKAADTDIVADVAHGSFYIAYDDNGTADLSDDTLAFRLRVDNPSSQTSFNGVAVVGIDGNNDGKYDLFVMVDGRNNGQVIRIMDPGTGANNSPSTTTIAPLPAGWLTNNGIYSFGPANYSVVAVAEANDPHWNNDTDTGNEGIHDIFVSWKVPMADLIAVMAKASPVDGKTGEYGPRGSAGITFSKTSTVRYTSFTLTQTSSINGDLNGVGPDYDKNAPLPSTDPMPLGDPVSAGPSIKITSPIAGDNSINAAEDDSVSISGTAKYLPSRTLTITVTDGTHTATGTTTTDASGNWTVAGLDLHTFNESTLTVTASATSDNGDAITSSTSILHDSIAPVISVTPVATSGRPTISGTSDLTSGQSLTVTIDPNGDGVLTDLVTYTVVVGSGGAWTLNTTTAQPVSGTVPNSGFTSYAKVTATGTDTAGNSTSSTALDKPAVNSSSTQQLQPTVTGTWLRESGDTISVTVNGVTYSNAQITKTDTTWSVALTSNSGGTALVAGQSYDVVATVTRSATTPTTTATDVSTGELTITSGPVVTIGPNASATYNTASYNTAFPTITGTASSGELVTLRLDLDNNTGTTADQVFYSVLATGGTWSVNLASALPVSGALPAAGLSGTVGLLATVTSVVDPDGNASTNNSIIATATDTQTVTITTPAVAFFSVTGALPVAGTGIIATDGYLNATEDNAADIYLTGTNLLTTDTIAVTASDGIHTSVTGTATYDSGTGKWKTTLNLSSLNEGANAITLSASFNSGQATATQAVSHDSEVYAYVESAQATASSPTVTGTADVTSSSLNIKVDRYTKQGGTIQYLDTTNYGTSSGVTFNATTGVWSLTVSQSGGTFNNTDEYLIVTVTGNDAAGNAASAVGRVTKISNSGTPATVTIATIAGDNIIGESEDDSVTFTGTTTASAYVAVTVTDGTNTLTQTVQANGSGTWTLSAQNLDTWKDGPIQVVAQLLSAQTGGYVVDSAQATPTHTNASNVPPVVAITDNKTGVTKDPVKFTFTFTQNVGTSFDISDIVVAGGTAGSLTTVSAGLVYELTVTPTAGLNSGNVTVDVATNKFIATASSLANTATASGSQAYDTLAPTLAITPLATTGFPVVSGTSDLSAGSVLTVTIDPDNLSGSSTPVVYSVTVLSGGTWSLNLASATGSASLPASGLTAYAKITAVGTDAAGNSTTVNALVKPVVNSLLTNDTTPTVSGTWTNLGTDTLYVVVNGIAYSTSASGSSVTLDGVVYTSVTGGVSVTNDSWTLTTGTLTAGTYNVTAFAKRTGSEIYDATSGELVIDTTPPAVAITGITTDSGTAADFKTSDTQLVFSGTAETNAAVLVVLKNAANTIIFSSTVTATGGTWTLDRTAQTALNEGTYTLTATATDAAGNTATATQSVVIDLTPPSITLTFNAKTSDTTPVISGITDLPAGSLITVYIDPNNDGNFTDQHTYTGVVVQADGTWSVEATTPLSGTVGVKATGTDTTGLSTLTAVKTLQILAAAPGVSINDLPSGSGQIYFDTKVDSLEDDAVTLSGTTTNVAVGSTVTVTITDGTTTLQFTTAVLTGGAWTLDPANLSALKNGTISVTAGVYDSTDDSTYADTYSFIHDKLAGGTVSIDAISTDSGAPGDFVTNDNTLVFSGSGTASQTVTVELKNVSNTVVFSASPVTTSGGAWTTLTPSGVLPDGTYTLYATIGGSTVQRTVVIDTAAPAGPVTVTVNPIPTSDLTPTITGTATVGAGEVLTVTVNGVTYTTGDGNLTLVGTAWTLQIPAGDALNPRSANYVDNTDPIPDVGFSGIYQVVATIRDTAGNTLTDSNTGELTVADAIKPVIDLDPSNTGTLNHAVTSIAGALVSLDDNGDAATLVEASDSIRTLDITVGGLANGTAEKIVFGSTTVSATGSSGTQSAITVGGVSVNVTYSGGVFTLQKSDYTNLSSSQAQAILRDIQYRNTSGSITGGVRTLAITATDDGGNVSDAATASVTVTEPDLTDPVITGPSGSPGDAAAVKTIDENTAAVADLDADEAVTWSITGGDDSAKFTIDADGNLAFLAAPDFENPTDAGDTALNNTYVVQVTATDLSGNTSDQTITVTVANLDDNAITDLDDNDADSNTVFENASNGTTVGLTALATDADSGAAVSYTLSDNAGGLFAINSSTGVVTVAGALDHETANSHDITVLATSTDGSTQSRTFTITVDDFDEVAPTVTSGDTATSIEENSGSGQVVYTAAATDIADISAGVTFSLKTSGDHASFSIDGTTGEVTLTGNPNFEGKSSYTFTVLADDGVNAPTEKEVTLAIIDLDEVAPTITSGDTASSIDENSGSGQVVYTAGATDSDDITAGVTFSLKTSGDHASFSIDGTTGEVTLTGNPNFEGKSSYTFTVLADDGVNAPTEKEVTLAIINLDEVAPTITSGDTASIDENSGSGQVVYTAGATDSDDITAGVTFSLKISGDHASFSIDGTTGAVTLTGDPDFETKSSYTFTILADDGVNAPTEKEVTLTVADVLDPTDTEAPVVTGSQSFDYAENQTVAGTVIGTVAATDDTGVTAFRFDNDTQTTDDGYFTINDAGQIDITAAGLANAASNDFETAPNAFTYGVKARDDAGNWSSAEDVTLNVTNLNDNDPVLGNYTVSLAENSANTTAVQTVVATDADGSLNPISYSLTGGNTAGAFQIDSTTGAITVADSTKLNYETVTQFVLTVTASDGTRSDTGTVTVNLTNLNDNPVSALTDSNVATNTVAENATIGTVVGLTALATDADVGATITYSLTDNAGGRFAINSSTGVITVASALDYETATSHTVTVLATSSDGSTNSGNFTIAVTNVNDNAVSTLTDSNVSTNTVAENASNGTVVGVTALATDADSGATVTYTLSDNAGGRFAINSSTGVITVANGTLLDYESATSHTVTVLATSSDGSTNSGNFTVAVTNVNDNAITNLADSNVATNTVAENAANGTVVGLTAFASDADSGATVSYTLSDSAGGRFAIDSSSGIVTVANGSLLDYESATTHNITVLATSTDGSTQSRVFAIAVSNVNDNPVSTLTDSNASTNTVAENAANGTVVGVTALASDADVGATITYSLTDSAGGRFAINSSTGVITVAGTLDYETATSHTVTVLATSSDGSTNSGNFTIAVTNVNDNNPAISDDSVTIAENPTDGTTIYNFADANTATDNDRDGNAITYSIVSGNPGANGGGNNGALAINASTGAITIADGTKLDYEAATSYNVVIQASDGTNTDTATLTINLTGVNDNTVTNLADSNGATNTVAENASTGTVVGLTAFASDPDRGTTISYTLSDNAGGRFAIDSSTGIVTVANGSLLDYESATTHNITVLATSTDGSTQSRVFAIAVSNVNDNDPAISDATVSLAENSGNNTTVYNFADAFTSNDTDRDGNAITYSITGGNTANAFKINSGTGVVQVNTASAIDFETNPTFTLTITASDGTRTDTSTLTVNLTNLNDNDPVLGNYTVSLAENTANGTAVQTVVATDADGSLNTLSYSITGGNTAGAFTINSTTGAITVADTTKLNYETVTQFVLTVTASDGTRSDTGTVTVNLTNLNDNPVSALTDSNAATNTVAESATVGTVVGLTALASDADSGTTITYSLTDSAGGKFAINATTGVITVAGALDYETATSHTVTVLATSSDGSTNSGNFTIAVTNVNDNAITNLADVNVAANTVAENAANGTVVGITALATDADSGATVSYSLSNNAGGRFAIDSSTGIVTVANGSLLNYEAATSHNITVLATSTDGSTQSAILTINLTNVNDNPVTALTDSNAATNSVAENAANGTVVGVTALATDADVGASVTYTLTDDAGGRFAINSTTGVITVADGTLLNYEAATSHTVTVLATSSDGSTNSGNFTVAVTNVNDNDPVLGNYTVSLAENSANNTAVQTVAATDADGSLNAITYSITGGNTLGAFQINATTGAITVADTTKLNYETVTQFVLTVTASDGTRSDTGTVTVNLTNVNDNAITNLADSNVATNTVAENASNGTVVGLTAFATDADSGATVSYTLSNNAGGRFAIDSSTGIVTVANGSLLDYESATTHNITVLATSTDGSTQSRVFAIAVSNVNDNAVSALTDSNASTNTVAENAANGTVVGVTALASDADVGATISYSLTDNAGGRFAINASTGVITVANGTLLDYESATSHTVTVLATSSDGDTKSGNFTVAVTNVNDNDPAISDVPVTIAENPANGTSLHNFADTFTSTDLDRDGAAITYSIVSGNPGANGGGNNGALAINASTGEITVADGTKLDYEAGSSYSIVVQASDGTRTDTATLTLTLTNVNDNDPVLGNYTVSLAENSANTTAVQTVAATDADGSLNPITYSITGGNTAGAFTINATTGAITVADATKLDYETTTQFVLTVTASDGTRSDTGTVTVNLTNLNDNDPAISDATVSLDENSNNNTAVHSFADAFTGTDNDRDGNAITYSILSGNTSGAFKINASTGAVQVADRTQLDYETAPQFTLVIQASDGTRSDTATLIVNLANLNDNDPVIGDYTVSIAENTVNGTVVQTVAATDADGSLNALTYSIQNGNNSGAFAINATTGAITVADSTKLDYEASTQFSLTIRVSDGSRTDTGTVTINLTNLNDNAVTNLADSNIATNTVAENATVGTVVGLTAFASDADSGTTVSYTLTDDAGGKFAINATTGIVTVAGALDYESATSHDIIVKATSTDGSTQSRTFTIAVTDYDEIPPAAPTVIPRITNDTTPTVSGTFDNTDSTIVSVVINGITYTPGDGNLSVSGDTWTLTIPAGSELPESTYEIAVTAQDAVGNQSTDTSSTELVIDVTPPSLEITAPSFDYLATSPTTTVTFTFDEAVSDFDASDVTAVGGDLSDFTQVDDHTWTATFTATAGDGAYSVTVADDTYTDLATNNGSGDTTALVDSSIKTVSFVDSFVGGISFTTSSGLSGLSDADGNFDYRDGDTITFKIGNITLGVFDSTAIQGDYLFIQDIAGVGLNDLNSMYVENMAILLQLLDSDHNAANGITISQLIRDAADQVAAFDLSLADKQQLSDMVAEFSDIDTLIPLFTADTELDENGLNVFESLAMAHVKSVIESLAGTRLPVAFDERTVDAIDVNAAVITYDFTSGVITFSNADLLANSIGQQVHNGNLIVSDVAISAAYAGFGDFVNNGDGTYTFTLHEGVTPYDIENFSVDYKVQDWTRNTAVTSSGLDTNKSHLSYTIDNPGIEIIDGIPVIPEDIGYINLTVTSALTFGTDQELTFSFTSERLSNESVQYAEFGDDFLIPFEYSNDGGDSWQLMSNFRVILTAGNNTLLIKIPVFDDAAKERALEFFDGTAKGDNFYNEKVNLFIQDNDVEPTPPLVRTDFVYSVEGQGFVDYTVRLDRPATADVTVYYATQDFGAIAGQDYTATSGSITFEAGETVKNIRVYITDDLDVESLEFALLNLTGIDGPAALADAQGSLRIFDNEITPRIATVSAPVVTESASNLVFTITLDAPFTSAALLDVGIETTMADGTYGGYQYSLNGGTTWDFFNPVANPGSTSAGHLIVQPNVTEILVRVAINDPDTIPEADDTFKFTVSGNYAITGTAEATALLRNDDGSAVTLNPVTPDNILSFAESGLPVIPVTGSVIGDAHEGDTVTIVVNGHTYTGTLGGDLTFSIDVTTTDLLADPTIDASFTSTGPDEVERTFTAQREVVLDLVATRPTVDPYAGNDSTPTVTGSAELVEGESLTVTVNGITYTQGDGHLTVADGRWSLVIPPENALPEGRLSVTATVTDAVGNTATDTSANELLIVITPPPPARDLPFGVRIPDPFGDTRLPGNAPNWIPPIFNQDRSFSFGFNPEDYAFLGLGRDFQQDIAMTERGFKVIVIPADIPNLLLYRGVPDSYVESNNPFSFTIPVDAFVHTQADAQVVLNATLTDGSALPDWLLFDRVTGTFEGVPPKSFTGELRVKVVARDSMGLQTEAIFRLFIGVPKPTAALQSRTGFTAQLRQFDYLPASSHRLELASR